MGLQDFYKKLNDQERMIFYAAVAVLVIAFLDMLFLKPVFSRLNEIEEGIRYTSRAIDMDIRFISYRDKIFAEDKAFQVYDMGEGAIGKEIIGRFLGTIEGLASESKIALSKLTPAEPVSRKGFALYFANVECSGKLEDVVAFMHRIDSTKDLLKIVRMNMTGNKASKEEVRVEMKVARLVIDPATIGNYEFEMKEIQMPQALLDEAVESIGLSPSGQRSPDDEKESETAARSSADGREAGQGGTDTEGTRNAAGAGSGSTGIGAGRSAGSDGGAGTGAGEAGGNSRETGEGGSGAGEVGGSSGGTGGAGKDDGGAGGSDRGSGTRIGGAGGVGSGAGGSSKGTGDGGVGAGEEGGSSGGSGGAGKGDGAAGGSGRGVGAGDADTAAGGVGGVGTGAGGNGGSGGAAAGGGAGAGGAGGAGGSGGGAGAGEGGAATGVGGAGGSGSGAGVDGADTGDGGAGQGGVSSSGTEQAGAQDISLGKKSRKSRKQKVNEPVNQADQELEEDTPSKFSGKGRVRVDSLDVLWDSFVAKIFGRKEEFVPAEEEYPDEEDYPDQGEQRNLWERKVLGR